MAMIESFSFGRMVLDGRTYTSDIIIHADGRIVDSWWREKGHILSFRDIEPVIAEEPDMLVAGTGANALMEPDARLIRILAEAGIDFVALPTVQACERFNELHSSRRVAGCFHLTC